MTSTGSKRASSHGLMMLTTSGAPSGKSTVATIVCIHVVPALGGVHTKMSPGRCTNRSHRELSETGVLYSCRGPRGPLSTSAMAANRRTSALSREEEAAAVAEEVHREVRSLQWRTGVERRLRVVLDPELDRLRHLVARDLRRQRE